MLPWPIVADRDRNVVCCNEFQLFAVEQRSIGDNREENTRKAFRQCSDQALDLGPVEKRLAAPNLNTFRGLRDPAIKLGQEVLDICQLRDRRIRNLECLVAVATGIIAREAKLDFQNTRRAGFAQRLVF